MKKLLTLLLMVPFATTLWAQNESEMPQQQAYSFYPPNYEHIQNETLNKKSNLYFAKLAERHAKADTTLDLTDLIFFYYGQIFQPNYSPYRHHSQFDSIYSIMRTGTDDGKADCQNIIKLANQVIKDYPAEPQSYWLKFLAYNRLCDEFGGDTIEREKVRMQFLQLYYAIMATGNGIIPEDGIHVAATSHEYLVLNLNGFEPKEQSLSFINGHVYDIMALDSNDYGIDTLYFNIDQIWKANIKMFGPSNNDSNPTPTKKVTTIDIPMGSKVVLELVKTKKKNSTFKVVSIEPMNDTLDMDNKSLFPDSIPQNQIILYFGYSRWSSLVSTNLIFKGNTSETKLAFDTYIKKQRSGKFLSTTNSGIIKGVLMNEIWNDNIETLRISNIRIEK